VKPLLALEVSLLALAVAVSLVFAVWRICGDVRRIREHFDRVDRREAQRLGYSAKPAVTKKEAAALADPFGPGSTGLKP
jgi:hypothetical protein